MGGVDALMAEVRLRAEQHPLEYGHRYLEGGEPHSKMLVAVRDGATMADHKDHSATG